ncbi:hypothetical protein ACFWFQ_31750 [Nocardia salmonicida]|uniref:hypothetical protein n=1 Tax=Nocardia salmonicida TaxID=53431 RepID=UPI00364B3AB4
MEISARNRAASRRSASRPPRRCAALARPHRRGSDREHALAERELSTLAARRPALRPAARSWREGVAELARTQTDDPDAVEAFVALCDGLCTAILLDDHEADPDHIRTVLRGALLRSSP